jgi:hypothetical protein
MSERALANYEGGERRIPRVVELACERVEAVTASPDAVTGLDS